nr:ribonuclease H-like domain-containing protein [Tanacetum cinerariifolium]
MFADVSYPLSVKLMEKILRHKLEIDKDVVGNDMTTAEQLIQLIKNQLAAAQFAQNYRVFNSPMLHLLRVKMVINSPWIMPILGTKELGSPEQTAPEEHILVRRESKARTTLLQSIPHDHVADFHYMDDARDVALTLKAKGGLELLSFDDLYYKLKTLEVDVKGYTLFPQANLQDQAILHLLVPPVLAKKISYGDSPNYSSTTTYYVPLNSKTGSHRSGNVIKDVLQSFVADTEPKQQLAYEDFKQIEKFDLEEMDLKWKMAMLSVRVHKFEQKARRKIDFDKNESARFNKKKVRCYKCQQRGYFARECRAKGGNDKHRYSSIKIKEIGKKEEDSKALITVDSLVGVAKIYNLITGDDTKEASTAGDAGEFVLMGVTFKVHNCPFGCDNKYNELKKQYNELNEQNSEYFIQVQAYKNSLKTLEKQKRVLQSNQLTLEDKIRVLSIELENTSNLLKHSERIHPDVKTAKKELQTTLDNHLVQTKKWRISSKNLYRLIDSSMSIRTKVGLGFTNYIRENKLGWDDSAFSVFTTNSEDVEDRPLINRFAKADSIKVVPPPLTGDYTSLSDHIDLDESQMSYGTKSSTSMDSKSVYNDFVSCDNSDKSSEAGHFRKNASSVSKLCFICGSSAHLIKDCDFYEKQIVNKTVGIRVGLVHRRNKVNHLNQFIPQVVLLRTGKVIIPPARPQPVPTGKPKVFAPVPAGRQNRPFPIPTDRGYPPSVSSGWWKSIARPMPHFSRPTSSYFQTYTSYVPTMSYTHMKYGRDRWATAVKPSAGCS